MALCETLSNALLISIKRADIGWYSCLRCLKILSIFLTALAMPSISKKPYCPGLHFRLLYNRAVRILWNCRNKVLEIVIGRSLDGSLTSISLGMNVVLEFRTTSGTHLAKIQKVKILHFCRIGILFNLTVSPSGPGAE